jgi:1,4-alpha-glucan branching enzyme
MYETFGAVVADHAVQFRLFFPDAAKDPSQYTSQRNSTGLPGIRRIQATGDFQRATGGTNWDPGGAPELTRSDHPGGWLYTLTIPDLPDGFYQYKYFVTFDNGTTRWCGDPCAKYVGGQQENAGFVIGGNHTVVQPLSNRLPFADLILYELMIDDFTAGFRGARAPVDAVKDKIDYLVDLGINAVQFMPWVAWPGGEFSWGYNPFLFFAVENRYVEDPTNSLDRLYRLKTLINQLHARGIHVILDGVYNHVDVGVEPGRGFPYYWLYQNPAESPFIGRFGEAGYFQELNFQNGCVQQFIFDACKHWLDEYQIDGIRFDYTRGFYVPGDADHGITKLVADVRDYLAATSRENVALILEHLTDNRYEAINDTNQICATGCWYDRLFYDVPDYAARAQVQTPLVRVLDTAWDFDDGKGPVTYVENHDHSTLVNRVGGPGWWWKAQPPLLALFTSSGAVMIHNGQEFGDDHYLPGSGAERVRSRPLNWGLLDEPTGRWMLSLHRALVRLRRECPSLRSANYYPRFYDERQTHFNPEGYGVDVDRDVAIYHRWGTAKDGRLERFIVVLNFSAYDQYVDVPFPANGSWEDRLNGWAVDVHDFRLWNHKVHSHWGNVFSRKG